jgi:2-C-methyl-D-erythritol 4-phosphate cytidylyltransferase
VVVAAGRGERLAEAGGRRRSSTLGGTSLLAHSLGALAACRVCPPAVVVHTPGEEAAFRASASAGGRSRRSVPGGATRSDSVRAGVAALLDADVTTVVAVHDAARAAGALPTSMRRVVAAVTGDVVAAAPALSVADTLKRVARAAPVRRLRSEVLGTVDRAGVAAVQTPQVFPRDVLEQRAPATTGRGDRRARAWSNGCVARRHMAGRVVVVPGSARAMKVTFPDDLLVAAALLDGRWLREPARTGWPIRVGTGLDVHPFGDGPRPAAACSPVTSRARRARPRRPLRCRRRGPRGRRRAARGVRPR